uniref:Uncharacterized protein n=1 Tax=Sphaerodactylus townsendi TaxID=933632 RepID=A0ACB8EDX0_9SAUR
MDVVNFVHLGGYFEICIIHFSRFLLTANLSLLSLEPKSMCYPRRRRQNFLGVSSPAFTPVPPPTSQGSQPHPHWVLLTPPGFRFILTESAEFKPFRPPRTLLEVGGTDEGQRAEATQMLTTILDFREQESKPHQTKIAKVVLALAMFHYLIFDTPKAQELIKKTQRIIKATPVEELEDCLHRFLKLIKSKPFYAK